MKKLNISIHLIDDGKGRKVVAPTKAHDTDAGLDFYYNPPANEYTARVLYPGQSKLFETGVKMHIPPGWSGIFSNRSSIASKRQLILGACVVDSGYDNEVFINLINLSNRIQVIEPHAKLAQMRFVEVPSLEIDFATGSEVSSLNSEVSERGEGGFGSTGMT